jgi:hypothetical protein
VEGFGPGFGLVCDNCLATRGVLDAERPPEVCPECGAFDPWVGPFAITDEIDLEAADGLANSPFYRGAVSPRD